MTPVLRGSRVLRIALVVACGACATGGAVRVGDVTPQAIPTLEAESAQKPQDANTLARLGVAYFKAGRFQDARPVLDSAVACDPSNGVAAIYLGMTAEQLGDFAAARSAYRHYIGIASDPTLKRTAQQRLALADRNEMEYQARQALAQRGDARGDASRVEHGGGDAVPLHRLRQHDGTTRARHGAAARHRPGEVPPDPGAGARADAGHRGRAEFVRLRTRGSGDGPEERAPAARRAGGPGIGRRPARQPAPGQRDGGGRGERGHQGLGAGPRRPEPGVRHREAGRHSRCSRTSASSSRRPSRRRSISVRRRTSRRSSPTARGSRPRTTATLARRRPTSITPPRSTRASAPPPRARRTRGSCRRHRSRVSARSKRPCRKARPSAGRRRRRCRTR